MPLENFAEPEVAVAAAVVGVAASPKLRSVVRRSAVYGLAGALIAYDNLTAVANGLVKGVKQAVASPDVQPAEPTPPSTSDGAAPPEQPKA